MGHVTAVSNQKGGVGKTTVTLNLGFQLADKGMKVLFIDNDPQGNLTQAFFTDDDLMKEDTTGLKIPKEGNTYLMYMENTRVVPMIFNENIDVIGATKHLAEIASKKDFEIIFEFEEKVKALKELYDVVIIDCLPSFGILQTAAHNASDYIIVPTKLDEYGITGVSKQLETANQTMKKLNPGLKLLGILMNDVDARNLQVESHYRDKLKGEYGTLMFNTRVTSSTRVKESQSIGVPVHEHARYSDQAKQYGDLAAEYMERVGA